MKRKLLSLLLLLMVAMSAMADEYLYLEISGTSATLKCGDDYGEKPYYYNGLGWKNGGTPWNDKGNIVTITVDGSCENFDGNSLSYLFYGFTNLETIGNINYLNTSNVTIMRGMFEGCSNLTSLNVSKFDTSNVTNMSYMFIGCSALTSLNLSGWNTSNVEDMSNMFGGCSNLASLDLSGFNTANVTNMSGMFSGCESLTSLDLSSFDTKNVEHMSGMFSGCESLTSLNITGWNTSKVTDTTEMFNGCTNLNKSVTANEGESGEYWATFYDVCGYQAPEGTQVFKVTLSGSGITMTEIEGRIVKSGEGVVLKSSSNNFTLTPTIAASSTSYDDNDLQGTTTQIGNPHVGNIYVLNKKSAGIGFYKLSSTGTIGANKAYLEVGGGSAREFFLFDETTGVNDARGEMDDVRGAYFDLQGRRVAHPTKGLYVVSGKKLVIK